MQVRWFASIQYITCSHITFFSFLPKLNPGVPFSTTSVEIPLGPTTKYMTWTELKLTEFGIHTHLSTEFGKYVLYTAWLFWVIQRFLLFGIYGKQGSQVDCDFGQSKEY